METWLLVLAPVLLGSVLLLSARWALGSRPSWDALTFARPALPSGPLRLIAVPLLAVGLVLAAGAFSLTLLQPAADRVTLPIEVIGPDGVTETVQVDVADPSTVDHLWVKAYSIGYPYHYANMRGYTTDKASIRLNGGEWIDINNSTVTCEEPEASARCVEGPMHTIRFRIPIDKLGSLQSGANALSFRFNYAHPDGELGDPSTGYRILGLELRDSGGTDQIDGTTFAWDDPASWTAPGGYDSASDRSAGKTLWHERNLLIDGWNGEEIWASCADCHVDNGYDLQYFAFSNKSIVQRARFHGLSEQEGKQIAAYIRSIDITTEDGQTIDPPGRPWDPPYQPGPTAAGSRSEDDARTTGQSFSDLDPTYWAAGAGAEWSLDNDDQMKQYLFPNGVTYEGDVRVDQSLNLREIPTSAQMPDWNEWLPVHHPVDVWGDAFESSAVWEAYVNEVPSLVEQAKNGQVGKAAQAAKLFHHHLQSSSQQFRNVTIPEPYEFEAAELSRVQWGLVKTFEVLHTNHFEDDAQEVYGDAAEPLQWLSNSRILFDQAPHIQGWVKGEGSGVMDRYHDAAWYYLQLVVNSGSGISTGKAPVDWEYHYSHTKAANEVGGPHSWRYIASYLRILQNADALGPDFSSTEPEGWWMKHTTPTVMERNVGHWAKDALPDLSEEEYRRALNVTMQALMDGLEDTDFAEWARNGIDQPQHERQYGIEPESHDPMHVKNYGTSADPLDRPRYRYDGITYADQFWTAIDYFGEDGMAYSVLERMAQWANTAWPKGDWMGRIEPYKDNPGLDTGPANQAPSVSVESPSAEATFTAPATIDVRATASDGDGSIASLEVAADGSAIGSASGADATLTWSDVPAGRYALTAIATDDDGASTTSDPVEIVVKQSDGTMPPQSGVAWSYFEGNWSQLPDFGAMTPVAEGTSSTFALDPAQREDHFGLRFTGTLEVPASGDYTFTLNSDDGSRLYIDGSLVVDNDGRHAVQEASGTVSLSEGDHAITVDYFEATGGEILGVMWASDTISKGPIPSEYLSPTRPASATRHTLELKAGWNLVSSPIVPDDPAMDSVLGEAQEAVVVTKNEVGDIYSPPYDVMSLSTWSAREAYQVYVESDQSITIEGERLAPDTGIELVEGWNYVPYLPSAEMPVEDAFASIEDALVVVQDYAGNAYIAAPNYDVNDVETVTQGQGYKVYVDTDATLRYPTSSSSTSGQARTAAAEASGGGGGVGPSATVIVQGASLEEGTAVYARTDGRTVGRGTVSDGSALVTVRGTSKLAPSSAAAGAETGDPISFVTGPEDDRAPLPVNQTTNVLTGTTAGQPLTFAPNRVISATVEGASTFDLRKNHPNPVRTSTTIRYTLPEQLPVRMTLYNVLGQKVRTVVDAPRGPGTHEVQVDTEALSSGVYFYRLKAGPHRESRKLTVVQ